ncbi:hypothetical protein, partial [Humibacter albus]|uniref:hypothetical protein n=1 Tax=Humibacter albus TaxID=427754 RepID=UPI0003B5CA74
MSETIRFDSGELVIANEDERVVSGMLLPFGVVGRTNIGGFTVEAGAVSLPKDKDIVSLNVQHDHEQPIGRAVQLDERGDGVYASFRIANTPEGDAALADIKSGKRRSLSMEAKGVIVKAGKAVAGRIFGAALVEKPAFAGATVLASYSEEAGATVLADAEPVSESSSSSSSTYTDHFDGTAYTTTTTTETTSTTVAEDEEPDDPAEGEENVPEATVPATVAASAAPVKSEQTKRIEALEAKLAVLEGGKRKGISPEQAFTVMAQLATRQRVDDKVIDQ